MRDSKSNAPVKLVRITTVPLSLQKLISGQMRFMKSKGYEVYMISSDFTGSSELEERENSIFIALNMTRTISPIKDIASLVKMIAILRKLKPQIVHTHTPKAGLIGMMASWIARVPIRLHTVAGLPLMESEGPKRKLLEFVEKLTYAFATKVYPNSNNLKEFIIRNQFAGPAKLKVIGNGSSNGIDTESFKRTDEINAKATMLAKEHGLLPTDFTFIFIGRLVKDKGIEELVTAFAALAGKHQHIKLLLVGPEEPELDPLSEACLTEIHTNNSIVAVGYQNEVRPWLALSKALVFPSYREGFPNVPMQAGCFDLPAIVTNINGCNEIIVDGENGLLIPAKDSASLQIAMERLYLDHDLYQRMVESARNMIVDRYEQQKVWALILAEYEQHLKHEQIVR